MQIKSTFYELLLNFYIYIFIAYIFYVLYYDQENTIEPKSIIISYL